MSDRLRAYIKAVREGKTEEYWDRRAVLKGRMTKGEFNRKWKRNHKTGRGKHHEGM